MASHSLNDALTAARLFHHAEPGHPPFLAVVLRSTVLACAGTSSIDVNVGVGTTGSSRAHAKMERYSGPKPSSCEFGQFTLKQMKELYPNFTRKIQMLPFQCPGIRVHCCEAYRILLSTMSCASGLHIRSAYSVSYAKTTSPSSTTAPPGPTSPAQLGAESERLIIHALMFCAISTMCTWRHLHVSVR